MVPALRSAKPHPSYLMLAIEQQFLIRHSAFADGHAAGEIAFSLVSRGLCDIRGNTIPSIGGVLKTGVRFEGDSSFLLTLAP
jgi:hypothetical protein